MSAEQQIPPRMEDLSRVTVTINGRKFRMACEQGQEAHVRRLAGDLDQRIGRLRGEFGEIGNTQLTVMAALTISDELVEMRGRLGVLERELAALQGVLNGACRVRTGDLRLAKPTLSQLS